MDSKNNDIREMSAAELEDVNGGIAPLLALAYALYAGGAAIVDGILGYAVNSK